MKYYLWILLFTISCSVESESSESSTQNIQPPTTLSNDTVTPAKKHTQQKEVPKPKKVEPASLYKASMLDMNEEPVDTLIDLAYIQENLYGYRGFNYPRFQTLISSKDTLVLSKDSFKIHIISAPIDTNLRKPTYAPNSISCTSINGKKYWGTDGLLPTVQISTISIFYDDTLLKKLDSAAYDDLYQPNLACYAGNCYTQAYFAAEKQQLILSMTNSDGAGGYVVIFVISKDGFLIKRIIGHGF